MRQQTFDDVLRPKTKKEVQNEYEREEYLGEEIDLRISDDSEDSGEDNGDEGASESLYDDDVPFQECSSAGSPAGYHQETYVDTTLKDTYDQLDIPFPDYIQEFPTEKQLAALIQASPELLYGGALAGGKSSYLLMSALQFCTMPKYASIIFRWQLTDLKQPGALIDRSHQWLDQFKKYGVRYIPGEHTWYFPTKFSDGTPGFPAKLAFGYIGDAGVRERYQSAEFQFIAFDELTQWPDERDYEFMFTRLRKNACPIHKKNSNNDPIYDPNCPKCQVLKAIPLRMRAATNPGGPGGNWVKKRWKIVPDPNEYPDRKAALKALASGAKVNFVGTAEGRHFIPSFFYDNPHVDTKAYEKMLENLSEAEKSRLKDGNWEVRPDARFKRIWAQYYSVYGEYIQFFDTQFRITYNQQTQESLIAEMDMESIVVPDSHVSSYLLREFEIFMTLDTAASVKHGMIDDQVRRGSNSWTVACVWGGIRTPHGQKLFMLDMDRFRGEIPEVVERTLRLHKKWNASYIKVEYTGVGMASAQFIGQAGAKVKRAVKRVDKIENSTTAMMMMKRGQIFLPEIASWVELAEGEIFGWTGLPIEEDDIIDNLSDAANEYASDAARETVARSNNPNPGTQARPVSKQMGFPTHPPAKRVGYCNAHLGAYNKFHSPRI